MVLNNGATLKGSGTSRLVRSGSPKIATAGGTIANINTASGAVFNLGAAPAYGNGPARPGRAWLQIEPRPQGDGYWLLGSDGAVAGYGAAKVQASSGGQKLGAVVGMASTPSGTGYWLVARDGAVASFGGARSYG